MRPAIPCGRWICSAREQQGTRTRDELLQMDVMMLPPTMHHCAGSQETLTVNFPGVHRPSLHWSLSQRELAKVCGELIPIHVHQYSHGQDITLLLEKKLGEQKYINRTYGC